jgi:murein DD-endopeptidase MepM/ murein hydrolase activator NlpD
VLKDQVQDKVRVGEVLVQKGYITPENLTDALLLQNQTQQKLGEILVQQGLVTQRQLNQALTEQKWRNWTAAALFSLGTGVVVTPKLAVSTTVAVFRPMTQATHLGISGKGGGNKALQWTGRVSSQQAFTDRSEAGFQTSLTANLNPSVANPLTGFCHPLDGQGYLSQGIRGTTHRGRMEYAYDLATGIGTPVYAMRAGRVIGIQDRYPDTGGGPEKISQFNYIMLEHDGGYRSAYLHLQRGFRSQLQLKAGDQVSAGQMIAYSGNSGWSSGPHLHVELQQPGSPNSFGKTVPFAIASHCGSTSVAQNNR